MPRSGARATTAVEGATHVLPVGSGGCGAGRCMLDLRCAPLAPKQRQLAGQTNCEQTRRAHIRSSWLRVLHPFVGRRAQAQLYVVVPQEAATVGLRRPRRNRLPPRSVHAHRLLHRHHRRLLPRDQRARRTARQ